MRMNTSNLVSGITPRKIIGTLALAFALTVAAVGSAKAAQALFVANGSNTIFDGVISSVGSNSIDVATNGNSSVTVDVGPKTVITGNQSLSDLTAGEAVKIVAKNENGTLLAKVINVSAASSYGTAGDTVLVQKGTVVSTAGSASSGTLVVSKNGVDLTFNVNSSTRFFKTSFAGLHAGDEVTVSGQDTGSSSTGFVAQDVFAK